MSKSPRPTRVQSTQWTVDTLHEYLTMLIQESDRRYQERYESGQLALNAALLSAEKAVSAALSASEKAVLKSEAADDKRFAGLNELRAMVQDNQAMLMPRSEAERELSNLKAQIAELKQFNDRKEGRSGGFSSIWGWAIAAVGVLLAVAAFVSRELAK